MKASPAARSGQFVHASQNHRYILASKVIFEHQKDGKWLAHQEGADFLILAHEVVIKLLNEALEKGLVIEAFALQTGARIIFQA